MAEVVEAEIYLEEKLTWMQEKFNLADADMAWLLLQKGTHYYFRDVAGRRLKHEHTPDG